VDHPIHPSLSRVVYPPADSLISTHLNHTSSGRYVQKIVAFFTLRTTKVVLVHVGKARQFRTLEWVETQKWAKTHELIRVPDHKFNPLLDKPPTEMTENEETLDKDHELPQQNHEISQELFQPDDLDGDFANTVDVSADIPISQGNGVLECEASSVDLLSTNTIVVNFVTIDEV